MPAALPLTVAPIPSKAPLYTVVPSVVSSTLSCRSPEKPATLVVTLDSLRYMSALREPLLVMVSVPDWLSPGRMLLSDTMDAPPVVLVICSVLAAALLPGLLVVALKLPRVPGVTTAASAETEPAVPTASATLAFLPPQLTDRLHSATD